MNVNFEAIEKAWFKPKKTVLEELEKWIKEKINYYSTYDCQKEVKYEFLRISTEYTKVLDKIQELKKEIK